jgi:8-amino-7-oxononanoate synthase
MMADELTDQLIRCAADVLGLPAAQVDQEKPLTSFGLDSIKAADFAGLLDRQFGLVLKLDQFFDGLTIADLAAEIGAVARSRASVRAQAGAPGHAVESVAFSLLFFASEAEQGAGRYRLFLDCVRHADRHGYTAVWTPERHFHKFGGLFPSPSVLGAAMATITDRVRIRAGSVVLPLHSPIRTAEEWAVVDNLSGGRVDVAFATGWNPDDFTLAPGSYADRERLLLDGVDTVRRLWRGDRVTLPNGKGAQTQIGIFPPPVQAELPVWITCTGTPERFKQAGALGANVLTALLFQDVDELAEKIEAYRKARADHGHDPQSGRVTTMLHTFIGPDDETVRRTVEKPFKRYLRDSVDLWRRESVDLAALDDARRDMVLDYAFNRYYRTSALFGGPETAGAFARRLAVIGVNEIACLIDFGLGEDQVLDGLRQLTELKDGLSATGGQPECNLATAIGSRHGQAHRNDGGVLRKARDFDLARRLQDADLLPFYTPLAHSEGATCTHNGRRLIMMGSNNYLGLTADPRVRRAAADAALADGPSLTGSRLLNGSMPAHLALERKLADFLGRADALLFTTGYQANIGLLSALMGEGTTLVVDDECHASVYDGAAVGRCQVVQFRHNDAADLERRLAGAAGSPAMVMVDGVYSMSGDLAPLAELRAVCDRHDVPLAVDDAHGLGAVGATGRGIEEELGVPGCADVLTGTFSKSLASIGGWLAGPDWLVDWVRYHGRSILFSAAIPPTAIAAASSALDILIAEPWRLARVRSHADRWRDGLRSAGFRVGTAPTAIVPVAVGDDLTCLRFARGLLEAGVYANCVVAPAVAANRALIRTSVTAGHQDADLDEALRAFEAVGAATGVLS